MGVRDAMGACTRFTVDAVGQITRAVDALGGTFRSFFDIAGQMTASIDAHGNKSAMTYTSRGWLDVVTDAKGNTVSDNDFDAAGNVTKVTDANLEDWLTDYDELGRVKKATDPEGNYSETTYWEDGRVKDAKDARGIITRYDVDFDLRESFATYAFGLASAQTMIERFDDVGFTFETEDGEGNNVFYVPDAFYRVDQVKNDSNVVIGENTYNEFGEVEAFEDGEGKITNYTMDIFGRVKESEDPGKKKVSGPFFHQFEIS